MISCSESKDLSQWRGPDRDGIFHDTNLLKEWPDDGPEMLWSYEGLGAGHGNVGIGTESRGHKLTVAGTLNVSGAI